MLISNISEKNNIAQTYNNRPYAARKVIKICCLLLLHMLFLIKRHSIRSFRPDPVEKSLLLTLADAAQQAPSASNLQAWRFLFITDTELREKVDLFSPGLSGKPPVILVICSDMHKAARKGGKNSEVYGCLMDASMAAENLMLKAVELGLGTCAIKSYNDSAIRKILNIPERYRIEMLMSIGYPQGEPRCPKRPPLEEICFFDHITESEKENHE